MGHPSLLGNGLCFDERVGDGEVLVEGGDAQVELFLGDDERRGDDEVADPGLDRDALRPSSWRRSDRQRVACLRPCRAWC